jgi:hypothetical protein
MGDGSSGARRTAKAAQITRTVDPGAAARACAKQTQPSGPPNVRPGGLRSTPGLSEA